MTIKERIAKLLPDAQEPFQLHDVLRAIGKAKEDSEYNHIQLYSFTDELSMVRVRIVDGYTEKIYWNLALPLDEQSPEVHEFLAKILTN